MKSSMTKKYIIKNYTDLRNKDVSWQTQQQLQL